MYWDSVKSECEKEKQQILSVLTEASDELLDISLHIAEVFIFSIIKRLFYNKYALNIDNIWRNVVGICQECIGSPRNGLC